MFGRRASSSTIPGSRGVPTYGTSTASRKNSVHINTSIAPQIVEKKRTVSIHSMPLSPRKPTLHRSSSIDLTVLSEDSTHSHHILQALEETDFLEQVRSGEASLSFSRVHLPGNELGFYAIVGPTQLLLWNSHQLHRALGGKESPAMHFQPLYNLPYPPEMTPTEVQGSSVILSATSFHNTAKICALVLSRDGRICFWDDINGASVPVVTKISLDDGEFICHASNSLPLIIATSTQTLWEVKMDDDRSSLRVSKLRPRRQGIWSHVTRFLSSATPSPILLTKTLGSSEMLVLHLDSTLERLVCSPDGYDRVWTFQLCGFMMDYFSQHEEGILVYAQCLALPLATVTHFSLLVSFQTGINVVLYLFEFMATMSDTPQYHRSIRLGSVPTMNNIAAFPVNDQSLYIVTPTTLYAISVPSFPDIQLNSHELQLPYPLTSGLGVLNRSLIYLHPQPWSLRQYRSFEWTLSPVESLLPDAKRYKPTLDLHQHRSLSEWKNLLTEQFQQYSSTSITFLVDDAMSHGLSQAVIELAQEILDAKPSTGLHWGDDGATSWTPQLIKYQLQDKATRHRHFLRFLITTGLFPALAEKAHHQLQENEEKLVAASTLINADVRSDVLLQAMHAVLVEDRGYTNEQIEASGYSVLDLFYAEITNLDQVLLHFNEEGTGSLFVEMMLAVETWRRGQDTFNSTTTEEVWTAQYAVRASIRRTLQSGYLENSLIELVIPMVPLMDSEEKEIWTRTVLVPLTDAAMTDSSINALDLIYAFEFLEGMAALSPRDRLHNFIETHPAFADFFFQWYAGFIPNPWSSETLVNLDALLHPPAKLLPALYAFLKSQPTLSKYAWMISLQLNRYDDVAACALDDAEVEMESLKVQKTMLSIGKLASYANCQSIESFDKKLLRVEVEEALELTYPLPPSKVMQLCLEEMERSKIDSERSLHWFQLAMDVVSSVDHDVDVYNIQLWRHGIEFDGELWEEILDEYGTCTNEYQLEHSMKKSIVYRSMMKCTYETVDLSVNIIDTLIQDHPSIYINPKTRPLFIKTIELVKSSR